MGIIIAYFIITFATFILDHDCISGDVKLEPGNIPMIFWNGNWSHLCYHYFWDNDNGAKLFCRKLGYESGEKPILHRRNKVKNSFSIGSCNEGDAWPYCKGGCNARKVGGTQDCNTDKAKFLPCNNPKMMLITCKGKTAFTPPTIQATSSCKGTLSLITSQFM